MRAQLHQLCVDRPDLDVVAEATSGSQALDAIQDSEPQLLLLDAWLPDMSGVELLRSLTPGNAPATIMVTSAQDLTSPSPAGISVEFLYKPVDPPLCHAAVDHAISARPARSLWPPRIVGEKSGRFYFLDANEVEYLAAAGNYVVAHLGANGYLTRVTLKRMLAQLAPLGFIQIDRSLVVNLGQVAHVERRDRGQYCFVMRNGERLISSR